MYAKNGSFDLELCEESKGWENMQVFGLAYNKRPLMVKARFVFPLLCFFNVLHS